MGVWWQLTDLTGWCKLHQYEAFALLNEILERRGSSEFGRVCQIMLGFSFIGTGYQVTTMQLSGRPDIVAIRPPESLAIEVKTSTTNKIPLKKEDLTGEAGSFSKSLIAVLTFPAVPLRWLFIQTANLRAGVHSKTSLEVRSEHSIGEALTNQFLVELERYRLPIQEGTDILLQTFRQIQDKYA